MKIKKRYWFGVLVVLVGIVAAINYPSIVIQLAPKKQVTTTRSEAALKADELFWQVLHGGEYERIPDVLAALTAAYLQDPNDAVTAAHIGFMHMWRVTERSRLNTLSPTITDHIVLARKYFAEAVKLNPNDARYAGFLASATLAEGSVHKDEKLLREGYFILRDAVKAWPEFNLFTAGYIMSRQPATSQHYADALEWQWENIDVCAGEKVDRTNPDVSKYMSLETTEGPKRACWNSKIAPHNFEGFFLNMGDMLVKAGDWLTAQKIYANARLSRDYASWKYKDVLEERIVQAQNNVAPFNADPPGENTIMVASRFNCMACHQK